jgi:hypothetical protein
LTRFWVHAQVRLCDVHFIPIAVARSGDPDAGAVLVRLLRGEGKSLLLRRQFDLDGNAQWIAAGEGSPMDDETARAQIEREVSRDPDVWVLEVDDPKERYWPDRPIEG